MDSLCTGERVEIGKDYESRVRTRLNERHGYNLKESTSHEDRMEKTDCWQVSATGKAVRAAIKVRLNKNGKLETSKTDILVALFDPFYGVGDPDTVKGRDMLYEYSMYISAISGKIRVAKGKVIHQMCDVMWEEFLEKVKNVIPKPRGWGAKILMHSEVYPGCQIWLHHDAKSGKPKLLAFISPDALKLDKDFKEYPFDEE